jgi:cholesterol transport system auxiliary component
MKPNKFEFITKSGCRARRASFACGVLALGVVVALAAGCGAVRPSKYYQLTVPGETPATDPTPIPVDLLVGRMTAPEIYRQEEIVYSTSGDSMGMYEYHRWVEPPTDMIEEVLLRQLRASGHFRSVNLLRSGVHGDYLLHGHLYDFKGIGGTTARVTFELSLRDIKTGLVVWSHFYLHDEPVSAKEIDAIVAALDHNIQQGIAESRASLEEYFKEHPPTQSAP